MLAANPVLAVTNPVEAKAAAKSGTPGVVSTVYSDWAGRATSGIAGVSYVNSAVDAAGNAAQWAENHAAVAAQNAASAAKSASDAAGSAADAHDTLKKAVQRSSETAAVGSATLPVYVRADGTVATITSYQGKATTAGTADKAIADKNGAQIDTTYEKLSNKVTALSANSTDTQYPSAKAVYTELGKKQSSLGYTAENTANKVTTLSATSTNTQYPGAKLVHDELAKKVDKDQGVDKKNLAMVTDDKGTVYAGYVAPGMIADGGKIDDVKTSPYSGFVLWSDRDGNVSWKTVDNEVLASGAVTASRIADGAVGADKLSAGIPDDFSSTGFLAYSGIDGDDKGGMIWRQVWADDIADSAVTLDKIAAEKYQQPQSSAGADGVLLTWSMSGDTNQLQWRKIRAGDIGDGAVTIEKTEGVVGMVPVGGEGATTYGSFWIE